MVEVRYFAAAAEAAGTSKENVELPVGATIGELKTLLDERYGAAMTRVLKVAAFLVADELTRDADFPIGNRVDVLPPFAGG